MAMHTRANRLLGAAALIIGLVACGETPTTPTPIPPPPPPPPPAPTPTPTPTPTGVTVSGSVLEWTASGFRPVPNLRLKVWAMGPGDGAVGGVALPDTVTDAGGRYTIADVPTSWFFVQTAPGSDHRFLCDFYPSPVDERWRRLFLADLPVVSTSWSGSTLPEGMWVVGTSVYGTVSERVDGNLQPVAGATVRLDDAIQDPPATTNDNGFYMICSLVGTDQYRDIAVEKAGYMPVGRQIFGGWDFKVDFELARK